MKAEMDRIQAELASRTVEAAPGAAWSRPSQREGRVAVGAHRPRGGEGRDIEMLQDLVTAAANDALRKRESCSPGGLALAGA